MSESLRSLSLIPDRCRERQRRLVEVLARRELDRAILVRPEHVQYLTGFRPHRLMHAAVVLGAGGKCLLVAPNRAPEGAAVDDAVTFEAQWHATLRQDQHLAVEEAIRRALGATDGVSGRERRTAGQAGNGARRVGVEFSSYGGRLSQAALGVEASGLVDLEPDLWSLRRRKDPDELAMIRRAIACTEAMYARARQVIAPGITEIEVFNHLHAAAVDVAGEPLTDLGNDYQANSPGGPPRPRAAQAGELFVLDLGPAYRGYFADNCRTMTIDGPPSDAQQRAWEKIVAVFGMVEQTVRPGVGCREVFQRAQAMLDEYRPGSFFHHLGHGIGLFPHEGPHLNPNWDDTFEQGDVFTAEPGLYGPELKAGIRVEENYLVTGTGVEKLTAYPLEL